MAQVQRPISAAKASSPTRPPLEPRDSNAFAEISAASNLNWKPGVRMQTAPASPISISPPRPDIMRPLSAHMGGDSSPAGSRTGTPDFGYPQDAMGNITLDERPSITDFAPMRTSSKISLLSTSSSLPTLHNVPEDGVMESTPLQYHHHHPYTDSPTKRAQKDSPMALQGNSFGATDSITHLQPPKPTVSRPGSANSLGSNFGGRHSPIAQDELFNPRGSPRRSPTASPRAFARNPSSARNSPDMRPMSYIDLLNEVPYAQQSAPSPVLNNHALKNVVGSNASLLDTKKTLDMYRANVKKTNDPKIQYEFAILMVNAARDSIATGQNIGSEDDSAKELIREARDILHKLSDRGYPFAQYYLADGYFSGFFNKGKPDHERAVPLFVAASKHGHAESGYRAALCYEFGWGTAKSFPKAAQHYLNAASKGHPGAATRLGKSCLTGDMGLGNRYREGVKWLKRATEGADAQYNSGPYELGLLHITGYGDDIFKDEAYAAQLLTQSAELGHPDANYRMGQAYELGLLGCPRDAALSVHFYNGAAMAGSPDAMMALCAWYMVGAEPVLEKDEVEAFEWAKKAAELGLPKAEYAVGYFTEMGIGCRRDPLEANVWYVRAADKGNETASQRLAIIRAAASEEANQGIPMTKAEARSRDLGGQGQKGWKFWKGGVKS